MKKFVVLIVTLHFHTQPIFVHDTFAQGMLLITPRKRTLYTRTLYTGSVYFCIAQLCIHAYPVHNMCIELYTASVQIG